MLEVEVNGTPASQLSTPHSGKSPSPSPTSPGSLSRRRGSQGSSTSLSSTKGSSPVEDGDGLVTEAEVLVDEVPAVPSYISDRYKVGRMLGDGNFAVVRECMEHSTGREYALKIINKGKCRGKEHMIQNEVAILRRVKHPNIVLLIEEFDTYNELYLVMELVKGGDLFDAITSANRYTERDASGMLHNLASAIKYLHSLNIVHRDIKPENLLVYEHADGSKSLKLGDFGLATVVDGPLYTVCGTPTYVAPEIIAETGYGLKVDIWAAGVITYILLCGFPPFRGSSDDQEVLFDQILMGQLEFPLPYWDNVSETAKELIRSMLEVEVDKRYTALQVLEHPWVTDEGLCENEHQLSVAGKIKKHFNTSPKGNDNTAGVSVISATPLDKERQVLGRGRHPDVKPLPLQMMPTVNSVTTETLRAEPPSCLLGLPMAPPSLTPDTCSDPSRTPDSHLTLMTSPSAQPALSAPPTRPSRERAKGSGGRKRRKVCSDRSKEGESSSSSSLCMWWRRRKRSRPLSPRVSHLCWG
ncbi:serine/threonine-protein kinase DCLK1a isoform X6 [Archocentrus centrarchus]|uniref:serine/threonine-protein kinase DCLK1a isoform X6 n=1 Tax=Archocentrus centrarchus TaxID=63155 RepID=UPI0011E9E74D|nr:serine/threonine-protein kinase DCLK1-like isoform X6 [Archocentrus centrarchus]